MTVVIEAGLQEKWQPNVGGERVVEGIHYGWLMRDHLARYEWAARPKWWRSNRLNKVPNQMLAWVRGYNEKFRGQILPIEAPLAMSSLLKPHYFVMIGICNL